MPRTIVGFLALAIVAHAGAAENVFPGKTWTRRTPAEVGMEKSGLDAFSKLVGGRGCVVRYGSLVYTWGDHKRRADVASAAKPFYSHFLFKAVEDKRISSLDEAVGKYEPRLSKLNPKLGHPDANITWRHLANQISCYGVSEPPGTAFDYSDWQMPLFWDLLFTKVYKADYASVDKDVLRPMLTDLLQCEDKPTMLAFGERDRPGRLAISPRDFARFGLLYLNEGQWNGKRLLSAKHATMAVGSPLPLSIPRTKNRKAEMLPRQRSIGGGNNQTDHNGGYSWLWWLNGVARDGKHWWYDAPADMFLALGHGGVEGLAVFPSRRIVVSWNQARRIHSDRKLGSRAFKLLADAAKDRKNTSTDAPANASPTALKRRLPGKVFAKWSCIELTFHGPERKGRGEPNPFAARFDVDFAAPSGKTFSVPGFYDGDGRGGLDGDLWKVRFSADEVGLWNYTTRSSEKSLHGHRASFRVIPVSRQALGFWKTGRLEAVGTANSGIRYFKFRDGPYWLKAGCDDPENFLGKFKNYNSLRKRKSAIDFLAERGINSFYIMLHTLEGDHRDVWPWLGKTQRDAKRSAGKNARFDLARLEEWRELFDYMQTKSVVPYLVLEDDSAFKNYDHDRYYREVIARFGYLPAVLFNLGEEANENYSLRQSLNYLGRLAQIDPFDHPLGIHNVNPPNDAYIDCRHIDFTAIQTGAPGSERTLAFATRHNGLTIEWIRRCRQRKQRVLMIGFDEGRPEEDRRAWWSAYMGGGVWEAHVRGPYDRPLRAWEPVWTELGGTRAFLKTLPFWKMEPHNELIVDGHGFCLAQPGQAYAVYLPAGGNFRLRIATGSRYEAAWWNPKQGKNGKFQGRSVVPGGTQKFTPPNTGDWALRVRRITP